MLWGFTLTILNITRMCFEQQVEKRITKLVATTTRYSWRRGWRQSCQNCRYEPDKRKTWVIQVCDCIQSCKVFEIILGFEMMKTLPIINEPKHPKQTKKEGNTRKQNGSTHIQDDKGTTKEDGWTTRGTWSSWTLLCSCCSCCENLGLGLGFKGLGWVKIHSIAF